jgi:hypothetical protein
VAVAPRAVTRPAPAAPLPPDADAAAQSATNQTATTGITAAAAR